MVYFYKKTRWDSNVQSWSMRWEDSSQVWSIFHSFAPSTGHNTATLMNLKNQNWSRRDYTSEITEYLLFHEKSQVGKGVWLIKRYGLITEDINRFENHSPPQTITLVKVLHPDPSQYFSVDSFWPSTILLALLNNLLSSHWISKAESMSVTPVTYPCNFCIFYKTSGVVSQLYSNLFVFLIAL